MRPTVAGVASAQTCARCGLRPFLAGSQPHPPIGSTCQGGKRYNAPNRCNLCHKVESINWRTAALREWRDRSPWQMDH